MKLLSGKIAVVAGLLAIIFGVSIATAWVYVYPWTHEGDYELIAGTDIRYNGWLEPCKLYLGSGWVFVQANAEPAVEERGRIWLETDENSSVSTHELKVRTSCNPWDMKYTGATANIDHFPSRDSRNCE